MNNKIEFSDNKPVERKKFHQEITKFSTFISLLIQNLCLPCVKRNITTSLYSFFLKRRNLNCSKYWE